MFHDALLTFKSTVNASFHLRVQQICTPTVVLEKPFVSLIVWGKVSCLSGTGEYIRRTQGRLNFCLCQPNVLHAGHNGTNNHTEQLRYCCEPSEITPSANILPSTCSLWEFIGRKCVGAVLWTTPPALSDESRHGTKTSGPRRHITRGFMGPRKKKSPLYLPKTETLFLGLASHSVPTTPIPGTSQSHNTSADMSITASKTSSPRSVM